MLKGPLGVSICVGALGMLLGTVIGLGLGIAAALKHNTWVDSLCSRWFRFSVFPFRHMYSRFCLHTLSASSLAGSRSCKLPERSHQEFIGRRLLWHMSPMANISRFTRSEMIDVLGSDYILLVQAKGVQDRKT